MLIELEILPGDPIHGQLSTGGRELAFEGWLELTSAIQNVCDQVRSDGSTSEAQGEEG